jgi:dCTP deaminase
VFAVFNAGPKTLIVREGDDAFLIWFARLEQASVDYERKKPGYNCITSGLASNIPRESASVNSLNRRIDELNNKFTYILWGFAALVAIAIGAIANVVSSIWQG